MHLLITHRLYMQDEFLDIRGAVAFLDSKRTCMQLASIEGMTQRFNISDNIYHEHDMVNMVVA
jgi:hypothetical protein